MMAKQTIELVPLSRLIPYARNARTHSPAQVAKIAASIREFGWMNPVLVDGDNGIIAGHGRVLAAELLSLSSVPCLRHTHLTDAQRRAYVLADNRLAEDAGWDNAMLRVELHALAADGFDLPLTGFEGPELADLMREPPPPKDPDAAPPLGSEDKARTKKGTVWTMGEHRLICGDSTDPNVLHRLMAGELADVAWTDPPYNVDYQGGTKAKLKIANDAMTPEAFREFISAAMLAMFGVLAPGGAAYVAHADTEGLAFRSAFAGAGFKLSGCLIWRKDSLVLGRSDYQWIHEPILYGWRPGARHTWHGGRKQTTVTDLGDGSPFLQLPDGRWQVVVGGLVLVVDGSAKVEPIETTMLYEPRPRRNEAHPTMKPVALIERMLANSANAGAVVLDPFGGSGSTLIAADRLGMRARLSELSRAYCDVIVARWQEYTGGQAVDGHGRRFDR